MPRLAAGGLEFEYDAFGDPRGAPLLLIMGLGAQMILWDARFCELLAARGFRVIRYDNRDCGLSSSLDHLGVPNPLEVLQDGAAAPYTLDDLAADAVAVLDALEIPAAHLVGASMGGFIAQLVAIQHPERLLSLTSIMSAPGSLADDVPPTPEAQAALLSPPPGDREGMIDHGVWVASVIHGPLFNPVEARRVRTIAVDRAVNVDGLLRQFAAIAAAPSRLEGLGKVRAPALVIHGEADPLVPVENGRRTAAAIPGARLLTFPRMGHDLPQVYWEEIVAAIAQVAGVDRAAMWRPAG